METVGPSATVPGIVIDIEPRSAFAHASEVGCKHNNKERKQEQRKCWVSSKKNATTRRPLEVTMCRVVEGGQRDVLFTGASLGATTARSPCTTLLSHFLGPGARLETSQAERNVRLFQWKHLRKRKHNFRLEGGLCFTKNPIDSFVFGALRNHSM